MSLPPMHLAELITGQTHERRLQQAGKLRLAIRLKCVGDAHAKL